MTWFARRGKRDYFPQCMAEIDPDTRTHDLVTEMSKQIELLREATNDLRAVIRDIVSGRNDSSSGGDE